MNFPLSFARLLPLVLLLATQAHASTGDPTLVEAKKMTRCAWMWVSSGAEIKEQNPVHKVSVEIVSGMLIDRSRELGASRLMQEAWMRELARQAATATLIERLQLFVEWSRCRILTKEEAARDLKAVKSATNFR